MVRHARSGRGWGVWVFAWWVVCLAIAAVIAAPLAYQLRYADRVYEGVYVSDVALGGLTLDEATTAIRNGLRSPLGSPTVTLRDGARSWSIAPADVSLSADARTLAAAAYAVGRRGATSGSWLTGLRADLTEQWQAWRVGVTIPATLQLDENRLALVLKQIAREVDQPPVEAALSLSGASVSGTPGAAGRLVDLAATRAAVVALIYNGHGGVVPLVVVERQPAVASVDAAVTQANALLKQSLALVIEGADGTRSWTVERTLLRSWLKLSPAPTAAGAVGLAVQVDAAPVKAHVQGLAKSFDRPSQDATLDFDPVKKQLLVIKPSQSGQALDVSAATAAISATLMGLAVNFAAPAESAIAVTLPVKTLLPKIDSTRLADLGVKELVTQGTTYFAGSSAERVHNIVNAAQKFQGAMIPPDAEFSFNKIIGDVSTENGFVDSLIIRGDRTELGVGGGVCQVSTTAFRAAVDGGFPIIERHTHSYVVSWYGEPGLDATIYTPNVDFRFKNDTGAFLLVKPEVDAAKGRITFSFYGTRPNRTIDRSKPEISNIQPPEPPIYQADNTLPPGTIKQVDWAKDGQDVVVKRTIRTADGKVIEEKIVSKYQPWRSVFLYGPGAQLPADAVIGPTATPAPTPKP